MKNWKYINGAEVGNSISENSWSPMQARRYLEEAKKNGDKSKLDEVKKIIDAEYYSAYKHFEELDQKRKDFQINQGKEGRIPHLEEARKNYELWKIIKHEVGNETMHEWATSKPRNIGNAKVINSDREFFKELADDAKEREDKDKQEVEKLVENSIEWEVRESDVIDYIHGNPTATALQRVCQKELGTYDTSGVQAVLVDEKTNKWAVVKRGTAAKKKTGNTTVSEYNAEIQLLTRKAEQLRRMGQGKSAMEVEKQIEKLGKELAEVGNPKVGNVASEYEILKQDPSKMHPMYKKAYEEAMKKLAREDEEFKKRFEKEYGVKAKNEAADDKFAYVMREFDEGKLKTPDGKVVTDPAQAKAIAYSESKKTENGLARARNAMENIKYKGYVIKLRPFSQKYYISSGPGDTYVREFAYKEYASIQDAKDAIDHLN